MRLREDVYVTRTEDGAVLLDERSGRCWRLNPADVAVLHTVVEGGDLELATARVCAVYAVKPEQASADVAALMDRLAHAGLVLR